jgi:hypothetical protein
MTPRQRVAKFVFEVVCVIAVLAAFVLMLLFFGGRI